MFLGLSLTIWLWIVAAFIVVTPVVGKQIAKDSLKWNDSPLEFRYHHPQFLILFTGESLFNESKIAETAPIKRLSEEEYIRQMMLGGVWLKLLFNFGTMTIFFLFTVVGLVIYPFMALSRAIFSTK